ncbi:Zn-dependent hydrolase [Fodinicurvata sp. EGI_FJ10296]|uniref:Zn-dependent hydrolase n=1 Tax=Fodinicurvata sp. EGI_FJ10296 TaxID=3231908 RepID=UPI0034531E3A
MDTTLAKSEGVSTAVSRRELARRLFDRLAEIGGGGIGTTRPSYSALETEAIEVIADAAREAGLTVGRDPAANLTIDLIGSDPDAPAVWAGSHLDSVPQGGNFDGTAGVIAALLAQIRMKEDGITPKRTVRTIVLRGEESPWFGQCYLGSMAILGKLTQEDLARPHRTDGRTLAQHMADIGIETDRLTAQQPLVTPAEVAAFFELHIEQGPVLVARNLPAGVVTGIRGNLRHQNVVCRGEAGHSGAVPRWLRHDAVLAVADLLSTMDEHWAALMERGLDLVMTAGILQTNPDQHAMTRIPGECSFSIDVRSQSAETLQAFHHLLHSEARRIGRDRGVVFDFGPHSYSEPAIMDKILQERLLAQAEALSIPAEAMPSGAGHDASVFANAGIPAAMVFVRNRNGSHNPDEHMDLDDFMMASDIMHAAIAQTAASG